LSSAAAWSAAAAAGTFASDDSLTSSPFSEPSSTFVPSIAFFLIFSRVTALFLICRDPTLFAGSVAAAYAPPLRATNNASVAVTFA
jgi:hypothetical protein